jgi:hypothetical protein
MDNAHAERLTNALEGIQKELRAWREQQAMQFADPKVILTGFLVKTQSGGLIGPDGVPLTEVTPKSRAGH